MLFIYDFVSNSLIGYCLYWCNLLNHGIEISSRMYQNDLDLQPDKGANVSHNKDRTQRPAKIIYFITLKCIATSQNTNSKVS